MAGFGTDAGLARRDDGRHARDVKGLRGFADTSPAMTLRVWHLPVTLTAFVVVVAGCGNVHPQAQTPAKTPAQIKAEAHAKAVAKARAARIAARARARARAAARARAKAAAAAAKAAAAAHAAYVRAANQWHQGYYQQDSNVYWKAASGKSCADYATNGCWHVEVITRDGCPNYLGVEANEYRGGAVVGDLLGNNGTGVPPKTAAIIELDADATGVTANDIKVQCE
jgi:hypothetical protein